MVKFNKIFIFLFFCFFSIKVNAAITNSIIVTVGEKPITKLDLINEIKSLLIINGQTYTTERRAELTKAGRQSLISKLIKKIELDKYNFNQFNKQDLNYEINKISNNLKIDPAMLKKIFSSNDVDFSILIDKLTTDLMWNSLIYQIYNDRLSININEIENQLALLENKAEVEEYLLSEILIEKVNKDDFDKRVNEVRDEIRKIGFESFAINNSISQSAINGGNLGWLNETKLDENFKTIIKNTPLNTLSEPILLPQGIMFLKIRDLKKIEININLEDTKKQLIKNEKMKKLNMYSTYHFNNLKRQIIINYH